LNLPDLDAKTIELFGGLLCLLAYTIIYRDKSTLTEGVIAFLSGSGIVAGSYLCILSFNQFVCENAGLEQNRSHVFIGGVVVLWISVASMRSKLRKTPVVAS
jgi:hypothetical protein